MKGCTQLSAKPMQTLHLRKYFHLTVGEAQKEVRFPGCIGN